MKSSARLLVFVTLFLATAQAQEWQVIQTHVAAAADAKLIGPMPSSQRLNLTVALPLSNEDQLDALLQQLYDPASPQYRQFLTVPQFTEQFGPSVVDYQRVIGYLQSNGLKVTHTFANRLAVDVSGPVASIERTFQVRMQIYQHPTENRTFYAPDVEPTIEGGFPVLSVEGLSNYNLPHPMMKPISWEQRVHSNQTGSGPGGLFTGSDFRTAYGGGTALDGSGQALGLIELGSYNLSEVTTYFNNTGQSLNVPITNVLLGGADGICSLCNDGEETLDIEQEIAIAPHASALIVYEAYTSSVTAYNAYLQVANDNLVKSVSLSFGWGGVPSQNSDYETVFKEMAAQGQSSFVASGDAGADCGTGGYPGNSPNITDVGGTVLTTNGAGGAWQSETGWGGSGGGWNTQSPIPSGSPNFLWNQAPAINSTNLGNPNYRNIPDVAAEASDDYFCGYDSCGGTGGTSAAAPKWAGFVALINQQAAANATAAGNNPTLGLLNPTIYDTPVDADFHDITTGSNYNSTTPAGCTSTEFSAGTGFDLVTGWGTPNGPTLINALAPASTNPNFSMSATPDTLNFAPGGGGTSSIAVAALNGFSATTNLTVTIPGASGSSAPVGLTASLGASTIPPGGSAVTLTVSTTSATPGGTYVIGITGTSGGGLTQTAYVTVALPWFELVPSLAPGLASTSEGTVPVAGVSINQGATVTDTIAVQPFNGFSGTVNLALTGTSPSGVTWSLSPATATPATTSTLTETVSNTLPLTGANNPTAVLGATITGKSTGVPTQSTTINLNLFVNPPASGGSGTAVDLPYNLNGVYTDADESAITTGLDGVGYAYSANILNSGLDFNGVQFTFGTPNQPNSVYGTGAAIPLPAGSFATLQMLATGLEGPQASQTITVTYTDSSTSQFTQGFSDWCSHLNGGGCTSTGGNSGESVAVAMPYRDSAGGADNRVFYLYHYSFALNAGKTVQSVTLPNNRNVVVLAATLTTPPPSYALSADATTTPASVNAGSSSTAIVTVTPTNGYTGAVTLSCSISPVVTGAGAPTCSFGSTSPVSITGAVAVTATVTFATVGTTGNAAFRRAANHGVLRPPATPRSLRPLYASWIVVPELLVPGLMVPGLALIGLGFSSRRSRRKRLLGLSLIWIVSAGLIILPACGGGSGSGGGGCSAAPGVPSGLAASGTTTSGTTLNWTASTVGSGCSLTGYTVYQNGSSIATVTSPTYNVTGLTAGTQYSFSVAASDSMGASAQSTAINVTTLSNGTPSGTYTITITGKDVNGVTQTGSAPTVTAVVN